VGGGVTCVCTGLENEEVPTWVWNLCHSDLTLWKRYMLFGHYARLLSSGMAVC
jgi:hypothetical protein